MSCLKRRKFLILFTLLSLKEANYVDVDDILVIVSNWYYMLGFEAALFRFYRLDSEF